MFLMDYIKLKKGLKKITVLKYYNLFYFNTLYLCCTSCYSLKMCHEYE